MWGYPVLLLFVQPPREAAVLFSNFLLRHAHVFLDCVSS